MLFPSSGLDDAYITYWPAYSLASFREILNYNGTRLEQSSSLLQVLVLAALGKLTPIDIPTLGRLTSILFGLASLYLLNRLAARIDSRTAFSCTLLTAGSAYFIYWSFGGVEATLVAFTALCLVSSYAGFLSTDSHGRWSLVAPGAATLLFVIARPEGAIVDVCLVMAAIVLVLASSVLSYSPNRSGHLRSWSKPLALLVTCAFVSLSAFVFRTTYFGSFFPQPVFAKYGGLSLTTVKQGATYLLDSLFPDAPTGVVSVATLLSVAIVVWRQIARRAVDLYIWLAVAFLAVYTVFILLTGGDWMMAGRFLVPLIPIAMIFPPLAVYALRESRKLLHAATVVLFALEAGATFTLASHGSTGLPLWSDVKLPEAYTASSYSWFELRNRVHLRDIPAIYHLNLLVEEIEQHTGGTVRLMTGQMGIVPFHITQQHFGSVKWLDRNALTDDTFTKCSITKELPRSRYGLTVSYDFIFSHRSELSSRCSIDMPDIIIDLDPTGERQRLIAANGYVVVYVQRGEVVGSGPAPVLPGKAVSGREFIAVRTDLEAALGGTPHDVFDFPSAN